MQSWFHHQKVRSRAWNQDFLASGTDTSVRASKSKVSSGSSGACTVIQVRHTPKSWAFGVVSPESIKEFPQERINSNLSISSKLKGSLQLRHVIRLTHLSRLMMVMLSSENIMFAK